MNIYCNANKEIILPGTSNTDAVKLCAHTIKIKILLVLAKEETDSYK